MKKTLSAALTLLLVIFAGSRVNAQPAQGSLKSLEMQDIDLSKIITEASNKHKVYINFGKHVFEGEIHNDNLTLSEREVYDIVHRVMDQMGLPPGFFGRVKFDQAEWERTNGPVDWALVIGDALTIAGAIPGGVGAAAGYASTALSIYQRTNSPTGDAATAAGAALGFAGDHLSSGAGMLASGASAALDGVGTVNSIYGALEAEWHLLDYLSEHHYLDGILDRHPLEKLLEDELKLYDFYVTTNAEIFKLLDKRGSLSGWKLDISRKSTDLDKTLFGADIPQTWSLECHLEAVARLKTNVKDPRDYQATYQGEFSLDIDHNMSWFDKQFKNKVLMNPKLPFVRIGGIMSTHDEPVIPTELKEHISIPNFTVDIASSNGTYSGGHESNINKQQLLSASKPTFVLAHRLSLECEAGVWNSGSLSIQGLSGTENVTFKMKDGSTNNGLDQQLFIYDQQDHGLLSSVLRSWDFSEMVMDNVVNGTQLVGTDPGVYAELKKKAKLYVPPLKAKTTILTRAASSSPSPIAKTSTPSGDDPDDAEYPVQWADWEANLSPKVAAGLAALNADIPDSYRWLLPEGRGEKDFIEFKDGNLHIDLQGRPDKDFEVFVARLKEHGFTVPVSDGVQLGYLMWEARTADGHRQCAVVRPGAGKLQISIEGCKTDEEMLEEMKAKAGVGQPNPNESEFDQLMKQFL